LKQRNWTKTYRSKAGLSFNNAVRDLHLPAESWKPHNQLNRINIMSDDNKLGLALQKKKSDNKILVLAPMITK
jgi:hypothetical protein